jgi:hypothetical protein
VKGDELANFKPGEGMRYVEEIKVGLTRYVLERDGGSKIYRKI